MRNKSPVFFCNGNKDCSFTDSVLWRIRGVDRHIYVSVDISEEHSMASSIFSAQ